MMKLIMFYSVVITVLCVYLRSELSGGGIGGEVFVLLAPAFYKLYLSIKEEENE